MKEKQKLFLYVDDDADDRELLAEAMSKADPDIELLFAENGQDALHFLTTRVERTEKLPCLIILDLNMPLLDGKQTFERLKEDAALGKVPVMVFTSSEKPQDRSLFSDKNIPFFTKPFSIENMSQVVRQMINLCE